MTKSDYYADPSRTTRRAITGGLVFAGAAAGAIAGVVLTVLGKIVAGAPPADAANYIWNATVFGVVGAAVAPIVIWSALRQAPLWRTVIEPLAGALVGAGLGVLLGSSAAFLALAPLGAAVATFRLERSHRDHSLVGGPSRLQQTHDARP